MKKAILTIAAIIGILFIGGVLFTAVKSQLVSKEPTVTVENVEDTTEEQQQEVENTPAEGITPQDLQSLGNETQSTIEEGKEYVKEHGPEWVEQGKELSKDAVEYGKTYGPGVWENIKEFGLDVKHNFEEWALN